MRGQGLVRVAHFLGKQGVDELDHARLAAKIQRQRQTASGGNFIAKAAKDVRVGPAKTVDRLLGVAHEKQPAVGYATIAKGPHEFDLQGIGVLKLVDQQQAVLRGKSFPQIGLRLAGDQVAGVDQEVVEVQRRQFRLPLGIGCGQASRDGQQVERRHGCWPGCLRIEGHERLQLDYHAAELSGRVAKGSVSLYAGPSLLAAATLHLRGQTNFFQGRGRLGGSGKSRKPVAKQFEALAHHGAFRAFRRHDLQDFSRRGALADPAKHARTGIGPPVLFPKRRKPVGRLAEPKVPVDLLPFAQEPGDHLAQPRQAMIDNQVNHRFVAGSQALAELVVHQFVEHRLRGGGIEHLEPRIKPGLDGVRPQ